MIPRPRKLLAAAAAPLFAAALAGCGTSSPPAARATVVRAPVTAPAPAALPVAAVDVAAVVSPSPGLMIATPVAAAVEAQPAPQVAATPLCDSNGRPLSGNVRTKASLRECTAEEIRTAAATPETE